MKYPKLRELGEAVKALIKGPYTSRFPFREHKPFERFRGKPEFSEDDCVGCGACVNVCPARAIDMKDEGEERVLTYRWDLCIFCGQCEAGCPTGKGIKLTHQFDLAEAVGKREDFRQEIRKKLLLCSDCGAPVAPRDQILWVAEKLGPLLYSNTSLMSVYFPEASLSAAEETGVRSEEPGRASRMKYLCPLCRREAVLRS